MGRTLTRFPCSARMRPGWEGCPLYLGNDGVHTTIAWYSVAACRLSTARFLQPRRSCPSQGFQITTHHQGFTVVHPASLPLACNPRTEREPLGFLPELHTRLSRTQPRMSGWGQVMNTDPDYVIDISRPPRRTHSQRATSRRNHGFGRSPRRSGLDADVTGSQIGRRKSRPNGMSRRRRKLQRALPPSAPTTVRSVHCDM